MPDYIKRVKKEMRKEKCKNASIGWYQAKDSREKIGIVITLQQKKKLVLTFGSSDRTSAINSFNGLVTMDDYDIVSSRFQSNLATLSKTELLDLIEFCMTYDSCKCPPNNERNCCSFLIDVIEHLLDNGKISRDEMENVLDKMEDITSDDPQCVKKIRKEMRREKCTDASIGWYQEKQNKKRLGIVITLNGKMKLAMIFGSSIPSYFENPSITSSDGLVKLGSFNGNDCRFQSSIATMTKLELIEFVKCFMSHLHSKDDCNSFTFLKDVIDFLMNEGKISAEEKEIVEDKLAEIASDEPAAIKKVLEEMRKEKCAEAKIGLKCGKIEQWEKDDVDKAAGLVITFNNKKKLVVDFGSSTYSFNFAAIKSSNGLVKIGSYSEAHVLYQCSLAVLTKQELVEFVEFCMAYGSSNEDCTSSVFLGDVIGYLLYKGKISEKTMKIALDKVEEISGNEPEFIKAIRKELKKEKCEKFDIGWYQKKDIIGHTGIVITVKGKKKYTLDFGTPESEEKGAAQLKTTKGSVEMHYYDDSYRFKGDLTTLTKLELIKFLKYCSNYVDQHKYNLETHNCRSFVSDAIKHVHDNIQNLSRETMNHFLDRVETIRGNDRLKLLIVKKSRPIRAIAQAVSK